MHDNKVKNGKDIYDVNFADYLPEALKHDPKMKAFAEAVTKEALTVSKEIKTVLIYSRIDELSEELIDILAYDMHIDWYDCSYPLSVKRNILKNSIKVHKKMGTKYAVEKAIRAVYTDAEIKEWFEYNGKPYYFKVKTAGILSENMMLFFAETIGRTKSVRSHIDVIEIPRQQKQKIYAGAAAEGTGQPAAIMGGYSVSRKATGNLQAGVAVKSTSTPEPITDGYCIDRDATADLWTGAATGSIATPEPVMDGFCIDRKAQAVIWPAMALNGIYTNLAKEGDHATTF